MPGRAAHQEAAAAGGPEPTAAGGSAGAAAQQEQRGLAGAFPLVLKKLMENPPREARLGERGSARRSARHLPASPPFFSSLPPPAFPPHASEGGTRWVAAGLAAVCAGGAPAGEAAHPGLASSPGTPRVPSLRPAGRLRQAPAARNRGLSGRPPGPRAWYQAGSSPRGRGAALAAPRAGSPRRAGATGKFSCCCRPFECCGGQTPVLGVRGTSQDVTCWFYSLSCLKPPLPLDTWL